MLLVGAVDRIIALGCVKGVGHLSARLAIYVVQPLTSLRARKHVPYARSAAKAPGTGQVPS